MNRPILSSILSFNSYSLNDDEKRLFKKFNPIGFNLFSRNIQNKLQLKKLINELKELLERDDIIFAIDQEGGRVRRLAEPEFRSYIPQYAFGNEYIRSSKNEAIEMAKNHAYLISSDLKDLGFNMNYAPVLDIAQKDTSAALKSRCFSNDKNITAELGKSMIEEYIARGIVPCMKHMPGHGRAIVDPHLNLPIIKNSIKELEKDFYPFLSNNNCPSGMTAHIIMSAVDYELPITQSKKAIDYIIRGLIGFDGLLISDAIDMKALKGTVGEKTKTSLNAGCDVICYALGNFQELVDICSSCSIMSDKSLERFENIKNIIKQKENFYDIDKISQIYKSKAGSIELYNDNYDATEVLNKMAKK